MKAAVVHEVNQPLAIGRISAKKPAAREVLVRTAVAGLQLATKLGATDLVDPKDVSSCNRSAALQVPDQDN